VRVGGHWEASGIGGGRPYTLEGVFLEVDPPGGWCTRMAPSRGAGCGHNGGVPRGAGDAGTRITLRIRFRLTEVLLELPALAAETSFERLAELLVELPPPNGFLIVSHRCR